MKDKNLDESSVTINLHGGGKKITAIGHDSGGKKTSVIAHDGKESTRSGVMAAGKKLKKDREKFQSRGIGSQI